MAGHGRAVARVWAKDSLAWVGCDFMVLFHMFHFLHCIYGTISLFPLTPSVFLHEIRAAALYLIIKMFDNVRIYIQIAQRLGFMFMEQKRLGKPLAMGGPPPPYLPWWVHRPCTWGA